MNQNDIDSFHEYLAEWHPGMPPLTTHWQICDRCHGEGILRGFPGTYTVYDFESDPEFMDAYRSHRRYCEDCGGTGKVKAVTEDGGSETSKLWRQFMQEINETRAIEAAERRAGA